MLSDPNSQRPPLRHRVQQQVARLGEQFASLAAAAVWPLERLAKYVAQNFFAASERLEGLESLFLDLLRFITWPLRQLWRIVAGIVALLMPAAVRRPLANLAARVIALQSIVWQSLVELAEWLNLDSLVRWLVWLLQPVWRPVATLLGFVYAWLATRPYRQMLWGLPALLLMLPISVAAAWSAFWGQQMVADHYVQAVKQAAEDKDYDRVQLFQRKLAQLGVETQLSDYNTAELLAKNGEMAAAYKSMQLLAPTESPGYPAAHYWIIRQLLSDHLSLPAEESQRLVGVHLDQLTKLGFKNRELTLIRAYWLAKGDRKVEAAELLKPLAAQNLAAAIERLRIDLLLGKGNEARRDALHVRSHLERTKRLKQPIDTKAYQWWMAAEQVLGDRTRFQHVLMDWIERFPANELALTELATFHIQEFETLVQASSPDPATLATLLRTAYATGKVPETVNDGLIRFYLQWSTRPELHKAFDELAESPDLPASLAEVLGTAAAIAGEWGRAQKCLEYATEDDPTNAVAWNNLAYIHSRRPEPDLQAALDMVNRSLQLRPDEFRFRETRGQIYVKLSRWSEAIEDLEFAINGMPDVAAIHQSLASAYEALGNKQLADLHRDYTQ